MNEKNVGEKQIEPRVVCRKTAKARFIEGAKGLLLLGAKIESAVIFNLRFCAVLIGLCVSYMLTLLQVANFVF